MSGCLWSFLPLFLLLPLYQIVYRPITHFMGLSEEAMGVVREAAIALGFDPSAGNIAYEQVALTEFISREWDSMKNTAEGLVNVDFNFLGIDLSALPTSALSGFRWEWGDYRTAADPLPGRRYPVFVYLRDEQDQRAGSGPAGQYEGPQPDDAPVLPVVVLFHACRHGCLLVLQQLLLHDPGGSDGEVLHQKAG